MKKLTAKRTINGYCLELTSSACPEQYDVFKDGQQVGYLRLRHGEFRVDVPICGEETVYEAETLGYGQFEDDEREMYLEAAIKAIDEARAGATQ